MQVNQAFAAFAVSVFVLLFSGCAQSLTPPLEPLARASTTNDELIDLKISAEGWKHFLLPGKKATTYEYGQVQGRLALTAKSGTSASMLRKVVNIDADKLDMVTFSWQVPALIQGADLTLREHDDSPVRIMLTFDGDARQFSAKNAMLSELALTMTGEPMPYATLMYVWCNKRPPDSVIDNPRTDRIRLICVESGTANLQQWLDYKRNIRTDFIKAFGEAPGKLLNLGIMTDSDNTQAQASAAYGDVHFERQGEQ